MSGPVRELYLTEVASPHPSGVGVILTPPVGVRFRLWRDPAPLEKEFDPESGQLVGSHEVPVLRGLCSKPGQYFDWDAPLDTPLTYWLEVRVAPALDYQEVWRDTITLKPQVRYSALEDGGLQDSLSIRDALVVYYSTRLAQLVREGSLYARNPGHAYRFPVVTSFDQTEPNLPQMSAGSEQVEVASGSLGWEMSEQTLSVQFVAASSDERERDSLGQALWGLMRELDWYLSDLGCLETQMTDYVSGINQTIVPILYQLAFKISLSLFVYGSQDDPGWQLVPNQRWIAIDDLTAKIE